MSESKQGGVVAPEQFRMRRLQAFNWGTFSGLHNIPISEQGFLLVGRSGSGKSTLLDGISALLVPPQWVDFNAAAREAERSGRDRSLVSYVRGAWADQEDEVSGEIATQFLRPGTTWSALALTYDNSQGKTVTLVRLFWIRGSGTAASDLHRHYIVFERPFDLAELEPFAEWNFDVRKLKAAFPDGFCREEFRPYAERFCQLLGIDSEHALRLLHKTQSAKNLGDLNGFLREFMLDRPNTFEAADRLVTEFEELHAAYQAVVTARRQVETLKPARERHEELDTLRHQRETLEALRVGVEPYREARRLDLLETYVQGREVILAGHIGLVLEARTILSSLQDQLSDLQDRHRDCGGDRIERWEQEMAALEHQRDERLRKRLQAEEACRVLGSTLPDAPQAFAQKVAEARHEAEGWAEVNKTEKITWLDLQERLKKTKEELEAASREVRSLSRQPSNIPSDYLELRARIAKAIGIHEDALPFVGELLQVKPQEAAWQGSIERLLRGFGLSILVDERHYPALAQHLDTTHLGMRLVYHRVGQMERETSRPLPDHALPLKVDVKDGSWHAWVSVRLRRDFDYACVESTQAFRSAERAVTQAGQVKHRNGRHEKDDRQHVGDRRQWVLGFDNREKLALFKQQAQELAGRIDSLQSAIASHEDREHEREKRLRACQTLANLTWQEIDVASILDRIQAISEQIRQVRDGRDDLRALARAIESQRTRIKKAEAALREADAERRSIEKDLDATRVQMDDLRKELALVSPALLRREGLDSRFAKVAEELTLANLDSVATRVMKIVGEEINAVDIRSADCEKVIEGCLKDFVRQWPAESEGLDASLAAAPDFFAKLSRLEGDRLPHFEARFFELLQKQSQQNIAALAAYLSQARKTILERMGLVNDSLAEVPFNQSGPVKSFLRIDVSDRHLDDVREFRQNLQNTMRYAFGEAQDEAEERFLQMRSLVERLSSQRPEDRRWRELVLDVRQHVEFIAREQDENGRVIEVYRSGAGKSGGQRQKLATTCLAAALRYQLGGHERGLPTYAAVVLDEAFDKADNEFTRLAMDIFIEFGFQMIVATPLKAVMTLEPYIGGACFVDIRDRQHSGVLLIEYDGDRQRLRLPGPASPVLADETA